MKVNRAFIEKNNGKSYIFNSKRGLVGDLVLTDENIFVFSGEFPDFNYKLIFSCKKEDVNKIKIFISPQEKDLL